MKHFLNVLALLAVLVFPAEALAQHLWQGTSHGMSIEEVQKAIPLAEAPTSTPSRLASGAIELLRIEKIDLVSSQFSGSFYFLESKLTQVTLSLGKGHSFSSAKLTFDALVDALRSKYGQELSNRSTRGVMNTVQAEWASGRTNISLYLLAIGGNDAVLNVNYQVRLAKEADKL